MFGNYSPITVLVDKNILRFYFSNPEVQLLEVSFSPHELIEDLGNCCFWEKSSYLAAILNFVFESEHEIVKEQEYLSGSSTVSHFLEIMAVGKEEDILKPSSLEYLELLNPLVDDFLALNNSFVLNELGSILCLDPLDEP